MNDEKLILVCNDDGVTAPGIKALTEVASQFGKVVVVAPDKPQSGMGHAITINSTLRINVHHKPGDETEIYSTSGTPVDCIKLAVNEVLERKPDLIVSGINHGSNASVNVIYSGTMSAAVEGCLEGIPSIGFSLLDFSIDADFTTSKLVAERVISQVLQNGLNKGVCLNVNIPKVEPDMLAGIQVCRQANANWEEEFDKRTDPYGKNYYWLTGKFVNYDDGTDTDVYALENNFASVVPVQYDLTAHQALKDLKNYDFNPQ
jgi:5'-nucleotidase